MADERTRDSECTRNAVLCAAERLFAEQGFAATSMRDISQLSGVSHPLIHHHFGSKNDLYAAVKRRLVEDYARRFPNAARAANRPLNVSAEMRRLMKYIGGNPMMLRLAARTRLEGDHQAWPGAPAVLDMLTRRITLSQKRGLIRDDVLPEHLAIMLMGLVYFWLERRENLTDRFGTRINDADYVRQAIAIIERGIEPGEKRQTPARRNKKHA